MNYSLFLRTAYTSPRYMYSYREYEAIFEKKKTNSIKPHIT